MEDNVIKVSVRPNKQNSVKVSSNVVSTPITANSDTSQFWSQESKNWAVSDVIVDNTDYSSKHYAGIAKESAENAQNIEEIVKNDYNAFLEASMTANTELQATKENALTEIESNRVSAVDSMNAVKNDAIDSINSTKTTILNDIEFVADGEKKEIGELIDTGKDELKEAIGDVKVLTTLEIGDIGFTQMAIDESKGLRRAINKLNNIIIQEQYPELTKKIKATQALDPDLFCTESEWQAELAASPNGVCYKYVIDDEAGTIRLPKYPDYLDLSINAAAKSQTVSVYGTGKTLGFNDGSQNFGLVGSFATNTRFALASPSVYGKNVGTTMTSSNYLSNQMKSIGIVTSASNSGLTGSVTVPAVESEKIKGTYFIQVATGVETEDNIINEIELNNPFSLLDYKFSEYELNNLSWLRSEGQYNSNATHPAVYELLLKIYNGTETKAGVSVKLTTETFTDYDFVLNTSDETFRLPIKVKQNFYNALNGNFPVVGDGKALGLTNGSTNYGAMGDNGNGGVMLATNVYGKSVGTAATTTTSNDTALGVVTNASYSGLISKITQTEVTDLYLYFYVGETVQNANLVNIGRIQEQYTTKSMVDGRWIGTDYGIVSNTGLAANTSATYDLSSYLPNDGYNYEVLFSLQAQSGATSGYEVNLSLGTDIAPGFIITKGVTRASARISCVGTATVPVGRARQVTIKQWSSYPCDIIYFNAICYRRIGTNL